MDESEKVSWFNDVLDGKHSGQIYVASQNKKEDKWRFQVIHKSMCFFVDLEPQYIIGRGINLSDLKVGKKIK